MPYKYRFLYVIASMRVKKFYNNNDMLNYDAIHPDDSLNDKITAVITHCVENLRHVHIMFKASLFSASVLPLVKC